MDEKYTVEAKHLSERNKAWKDASDDMMEALDKVVLEPFDDEEVVAFLRRLRDAKITQFEEEDYE